MDEIQIVDLTNGPRLAIVDGEGDANAVIWPGMGAELRSIHVINLGPGARTVELSHGSDAVYHVNSGSGCVIDPESGAADALHEGSMIHVDAGTRYRVQAGADGIALVGGPSPPDRALYEEVS